jgi:hypothetical protein
MVRELRVDAAEARPEESAQTPTTKAAAKSIGVKFFIPESLIFELRNWPRSRVPKFLAGRPPERSPSPFKINRYPERP